MPTNPGIDELADQSKIIIIGTVLTLAASTVQTHPASSHTVVVRVDRIIRMPPALGNLGGRQITVELTAAPGVRVGQRAFFFANGLVYADSLVVKEVGRIDVPPAAAAREALVTQIGEAVQTAPDRVIQRHLTTAQVVVTGKVASIRKVPRPPGSPISEHDPDWRQAVVDVESVESGLPVKQVAVLFPASRDVRWRQSPKFTVGQEGVWILHQHQMAELRAPGYTALHPFDFHPKPQRNRIRALIRGRK
jgi:hypothetical protein